MATNDQGNAAAGDLNLDQYFTNDDVQAPAAIPEQGQAPAAPGAPAEVPQAKSDPTRFEYWQSQADQYKRRAEALEPYAPIVEYLQNNPQAIQAIQNTVTPRETNQPQSGAAPAPTGLKPPTAPSKPESYDDAAAYSDPTSESFKYRQKMTNYRDEMLDFYAKKEEAREAAFQEQLQTQAQERAVKAQMAQAQVVLQTQYGFKPQEAIDFIQVMGDDRVVSMENMVKLYRVLRSQPQQPTQPTTRPANFGPQSPALGQGFTEPQLEEGDQFNLSMSQYKRK